MKKFFAACISVFACLFIYGFSFAETVSISGAVTNFSSSSNLALDDITIEVTGTMNFQVKTGKNGKYKISGLEKGGTYTLTVSKPGYDFVPVTKLFENLGKNETNQNFSVESVKFSISGKVVFGGKPLKGVAVTINDDPTKYYTDANGDYIIDIAETKGPYEVKVISDEYYFEPFTINSLKESIVHDFRKDIAISGRVVSLGEGVPGLEVDINGSKYITDENGYYKVESAVANTDYVIKIADNNFFSSPKSIPIKKITKSREHLDFDVTGQFSGKVVYNGKPFKNVTVEISDRDSVVGTDDVHKEYKTDSHGTFKIANLGLTKHYRISVSNEGYTFEPREKIIDSLVIDSAYQTFVAEKEEFDLSVKEDESNDFNSLEQQIAEKKEQLRLAKEEKERLKAEKEEELRLAKEEKERAKQEAKAQAQFDAELKKLEKEEKARILAEEKERQKAEKQAKLEEAKAEKERIKAEKEEELRLAKEEKEKARREAKADALFTAELKKLEKEEKERAKEEAKEQARLALELKKMEAEEKAMALAEEKERKETEKQAKIEEAKAEKERIKAEKEEQLRLAREEKERRLAEMKARLEEAKAEKEEELRLAKEEKEKAKQESADQARLALELKKMEAEEKARVLAEEKEKKEAENQAKIEEAEAEKERIAAEKQAKLEEAKAEKEEQLRLAKEEKERLKSEKEEQKRLAKEIEKEKEDRIEEAKALLMKQNKKKGKFFIQGRILKSKYGLKGVQVRLLLENEEKIYLTDKNGYYKISDLEEGGNYLVTVLSGKEVYNLSPKSRTYKNLSKNMTDQNFYAIEKIIVTKRKDTK